MHDIAMAALSVFLMQSLALLVPAPTRPACRSAPLGARASRPHVGRRPTGVQAGKMPALPGIASADRVDLPGETQNENCWPEPRRHHMPLRLR